MVTKEFVEDIVSDLKKFANKAKIGLLQKNIRKKRVT